MLCWWAVARRCVSGGSGTHRNRVTVITSRLTVIRLNAIFLFEDDYFTLILHVLSDIVFLHHVA